MMAVNQPSGAWWKQLSNHLHERTHSRLRGLQIRAVGGRISIQASAPSDRVRNQAEAAAREVVPEGLLAMRIRVVGANNPATEAASDEPAVERTLPPLCSGHMVYRRLSRLVHGKDLDEN